jgi:hypothetical protein
VTSPSAQLVAPSPDVSISAPAEELLDAVRAILMRVLTKPLTKKEVAELLGVQSNQAITWLNALVEQRALTIIERPTRYVVSRSETNAG